MTHKHEWLPTADQPGVEATTYFGWCECEETLDLTELCKRANATEELPVELVISLVDGDETNAGNSLLTEEEADALRAYAEKRGEG